MGFLASILVHEFAHALTARHYDVETESIQLWALGAQVQPQGRRGGLSGRIGGAKQEGALAAALRGQLQAAQQQLPGVTWPWSVRRSPPRHPDRSGGLRRPAFTLTRNQDFLEVLTRADVTSRSTAELPHFGHFTRFTRSCSS